jgi:hypothetical protein
MHLEKGSRPGYRTAVNVVARIRGEREGAKNIICNSHYKQQRSLN